MLALAGGGIALLLWLLLVHGQLGVVECPHHSVDFHRMAVQFGGKGQAPPDVAAGGGSERAPQGGRVRGRAAREGK